MPESQATLDGEGGRKVTITIAEMSASELAAPADPGEDPNTFVIANGKYKLTITIAE
jgi:hypothetical protein